MSECIEKEIIRLVKDIADDEKEIVRLERWGLTDDVQKYILRINRKIELLKILRKD